MSDVVMKPITAWPKIGKMPVPGRALIFDRRRGFLVAEVRGFGWVTVPGAWQVAPMSFCELPDGSLIDGISK